MLKTILKWVGIVVGALVVVIVCLGVWFYAKSNRAIARTFTIDQPALAIPTDSASIQRGRHIASAVSSCIDCHAEHLGGQMVIDQAPFMRLGAPNLTRGAGGVGATLTDADFVRAIRHGVGPDGRALALMPSEAYQHFSDADLGAVIAYVKSVAPVDNPVPPREFGPIARMLLARGQFPLFHTGEIDHAAARSVTAPADTTSADYGHYMANIAGCTSCHGPGLSGGAIPGAPPEAPPAPNITPSGIGTWTEADFFRALREGKGSGGRQLNAFMPYRYFKDLSDGEIRALWAFVHSVPSKEYGHR